MELENFQIVLILFVFGGNRYRRLERWGREGCESHWRRGVSLVRQGPRTPSRRAGDNGDYCVYHSAFI